MPTPTLVILNPVAGQGDFAKTRDTITQFLEKRGLPFEIRETAGEGDALKWTRDAVGFGRVIVGGGDGTVMEAMTGMIKNPSPIPLAQIPLGTANLLTRALAIPTDLEEALGLATGDGVAVDMDVGYLPHHDRYFAIVAGSGFDAEMIAGADRELKNRLGFGAYLVSGIKNIFSLKRSRVRVTIDGVTHRFRAHTVMVINVGEIYGTGISLGDGLSPHDGRLDLAIASSNTLAGILRLFARLATKRFDNSSELQYFSAEKIRVEATPPLKLEIDGEQIGETPFEVEVVPNGARLIVPREYAEAKKLTPIPLG